MSVDNAFLTGRLIAVEDILYVLTRRLLDDRLISENTLKSTLKRLRDVEPASGKNLHEKSDWNSMVWKARSEYIDGFLSNIE